MSYISLNNYLLMREVIVQAQFVQLIYDITRYMHVLFNCILVPSVTRGPDYNTLRCTGNQSQGSLLPMLLIECGKPVYILIADCICIYLALVTDITSYILSLLTQFRLFQLKTRADTRQCLFNIDKFTHGQLHTEMSYPCKSLVR